MRKNLQSSEEFHETLREELQVSREFDLVLCALCIRVPEGLDAETARRLLDGIRSADLAAAVSAHELAIMLPNTSPGNARTVAGRLLAAVPEAEAGQAPYEPGDTPETLLARARQSLEEYGS